MEYQRQANPRIAAQERIKNHKEFYQYQSEEDRKVQAARCMDCGVPFCGSALELKGMVTGCPLNNLIPEWNDEIYRGNYAHALSRLLKTSPFPEFTGRVCPALCEKACVNGMLTQPVTIHDNELFLIEEGFKSGAMTPKIPAIRSDKTVAVVGSGPSGLAVAEKLNKRGHTVTVYEKEDRIGGLLMYGIPNMKLDKSVITRRVDLMTQEGITFLTEQELGKNLKIEQLEEQYDAVILCCGWKKPRDLALPHREAQGIHFAVDFLTSTTKSLLENNLSGGFINAKGKNVVILGGGDTGNDCVGTAIRHGAKSVLQIEMMPKPPETRLESNPWPEWPKTLNTDYGQEEAIQVFGSDPRVFQTTIDEIYQTEGKLTGIRTVEVEFKKGQLVKKEGTGTEIKADLLLIAAGFVGYEDGIAPQVAIPNKAQPSFQTDKEGIFACGDMKRGQSLVVWAIADGIKCAREVDLYLMGYSY